MSRSGLSSPGQFSRDDAPRSGVPAGLGLTAKIQRINTTLAAACLLGFEALEVEELAIRQLRRRHIGHGLEHALEAPGMLDLPLGQHLLDHLEGRAQLVVFGANEIAGLDPATLRRWLIARERETPS